ncbi:hypothetical protein B0H12DRAFT_1221956 [Mycena haematopus]|nr:hypothetical protein B0H12DRAFT_1221956 [Mycena haematopus]
MKTSTKRTKPFATKQSTITSRSFLKNSLSLEYLRTEKRKARESTSNDDNNKRIRSESVEPPPQPLIASDHPVPPPNPATSPLTNTNDQPSSNPPPPKPPLRFHRMPAETPNAVRLAEGVIQMTNGQQYTAPPPHGFPIPQCIESPLRNTTDHNRAVWAAQEGPKGWVRVYRAKYEPNARGIVSKLKFVISRLVEAPNVIISPPTAREELEERLPAPWHFLISSISAESLTRLTAQGVWSTPTISFFVFDYSMPLPRYIMTLQNFTVSDDPEGNKFVARVVAAKLKSIKEASEFLIKHSAAEDAKTAAETLDTIEVHSLEISLPGGGTDTIWNIYCSPPTSISFFDFLVWTKSARGIQYDTNYHGTGVARMGAAQLFCVGCKSYDHPTGLCPLPRIVGWFGPSAKSTSAEDKTLLQEDERHEKASKGPKSGKPKAGRGAARGGNRGGRRR